MKALGSAGAAVIAFDSTYPEAERNPAEEVLIARGSSLDPALRAALSAETTALDPDRILAAALAANPVVLGFTFTGANVPGKGSLPAATRERIALAVAEINGCNYCLAAHAFLGKKFARLDEAEILANRNGHSGDPKADAAVKFAAAVTTARGHVSDHDLQAVKLAGYDDAQVVEIVLHVALNTLTNYVNEVARTELDFPAVTALAA